MHSKPNNCKISDILLCLGENSNKKSLNALRTFNAYSNYVEKSQNGKNVYFFIHKYIAIC